MIFNVICIVCYLLSIVFSFHGPYGDLLVQETRFAGHFQPQTSLTVHARARKYTAKDVNKHNDVPSQSLCCHHYVVFPL